MESAHDVRVTVPRMHVETHLPSGVRARMWVTQRCAVIEANGKVTFAPSFDVPVDAAIELGELLAELREA